MSAFREKKSCKYFYRYKKTKYENTKKTTMKRRPPLTPGNDGNIKTTFCFLKKST